MKFSKEVIEKYLDLVAVKRVVSGYKIIAELENTTLEAIKEKWSNDGGINGYIADKLKLDLEEFGELASIEEVVAKKEKIDKLFSNQYTGSRKEGFKSFIKFYEWYEKQGNQCYYCKTDSKTLQELFDSNKLKSTKFNETLHIERLRPKEDYSPDNCRLACSLCNNAKSDLISNENYENYFGNAMRRFLIDLSNDNIENNTMNSLEVQSNE
ncbi:MAG: hypothetical protein PHZ17_01700 [Sulfurovum sp.]|nr:hypothetical protein [Sulfurovum sp.]